jgi:hypothetical protein
LPLPVIALRIGRVLSWGRLAPDADDIA